MKLENLNLYEPEAPAEDEKPDRSHWVDRLDDLDLEAETLMHYQTVREYTQNMDLKLIEPQKVASVYSTLTRVLRDLTKIQTDLNNAEKFKRLEASLIRALRTLPTEAQDVFLENYKIELAR
jgi:hypothetical protein